MRLVYTVDAVEDLARLFDFIEVHDPDAAARVSRQLIEGIEGLLSHPQIGTNVSRSLDDHSIRDLVIGHYVARYLFREDIVVILRIWHQREEK